MERRAVDVQLYCARRRSQSSGEKMHRTDPRPVRLVFLRTCAGRPLPRPRDGGGALRLAGRCISPFTTAEMSVADFLPVGCTTQSVDGWLTAVRGCEWLLRDWRSAAEREGVSIT